MAPSLLSDAARDHIGPPTAASSRIGREWGPADASCFGLPNNSRREGWPVPPWHFARLLCSFGITRIAPDPWRGSSSPRSPDGASIS